MAKRAKYQIKNWN